MNKQQILDRTEVIWDTCTDAGLAAWNDGNGSDAFFRARDAERKKYSLELERLYAACDGHGGHAYSNGRVCICCGYDKTTPQQVLAANLTKHI